MVDDGRQFHFDPATYLELVTSDIPDYVRLQERTAEASANLEVQRVLDLGAGTGETAVRVLGVHEGATLVGIDENEAMLAVARERLPDAELRVARLEERLPEGPFDLAVAVLAVHHLDAPGKQDLFQRVYQALRAGGRFVLTDVVVPEDPNDVRIAIDGIHDQPSSAADQIDWLEAVGFSARVEWSREDLAIIVADRSS